MTNNSIILLSAYISIALSIIILSYITLNSYIQTTKYQTSIDKTKQFSILKNYIYPIATLLKKHANRSSFIRDYNNEFEKLITQTGGYFWGGLDGYDILGIKLVSPFLVFTIIMFIGYPFDIEMGLVAIAAIFFSILSYMYPDSILKATAEQRKHNFMSQLPGGLDILKVAADAGLDFHSSVDYLVEIYIPGSLKEEMKMFQRELKLGIPTVTALSNIAQRIDVPEASLIFISLAQSIEMGTSIVDMLDATTREMRTKQKLWAQENAQKAVVKITFPLLLLILPGIFIILLAPILNPLIKVFNNFAH